MRRSSHPSRPLRVAAATLASLALLAALACGRSDRLFLADGCAVPADVSAVPIALAGDWWAEGAMPPTLRVEQDGSALRAELAFSGVRRQGGTGRVRGACVELSFPGRAGTDEPALLVAGRMDLAAQRLRIALPDGTAFTLVRRPAGQ